MPEYWKDRLVKLKAMGLNTVETYVAWNLHEQVQDNFKFKDELDIVKFVKLAQRLGLYVIIRPGPYICAEWDLGGLPSWLLSDPEMKLRTSYGPFMEAVDRYFQKLFPLLTPLQYCQGGPIIAWQIENEYSSFDKKVDMTYMELLQKMMVKNGVTEMLLMSDNLFSMKTHPINLVLKTINLQKNVKDALLQLKEIQPDKPLMVTEFWPGWFDVWGAKHHILPTEKLIKEIKDLFSLGASINFYMFHGGTNFGFMNGASFTPSGVSVLEGDYQPDITSYDYDAPLSESGDITPKYKALRKFIREHAPNPFPDIPSNLYKGAYGKTMYLFNFLIEETDQKIFDQAIVSDTVKPVEFLPINNHGGQGYGFVIYQTALKHDAKSLVVEIVRDRAHVMVDSKVISTLCGYDAKKRTFSSKKLERNELELKFEKPNDEDDKVLLEIMVENMGRANFGKAMDAQRKGILGKVLIDGKTPRKWKIYPLDFHKTFTERFPRSSWSQAGTKINGSVGHSPGFYRGILHIQGQPRDTFVHPKGWGKGVCLVNGKNLGRYWKLGPQETLYLPASWLRSGENTV
ncbi:predicted protein, partial [Nematostella vectensis]